MDQTNSLQHQHDTILASPERWIRWFARLLPLLLGVFSWLWIVAYLVRPDFMSISLTQQEPSQLQVFWDVGNGIQEADSMRIAPSGKPGARIDAQIPLPYPIPSLFRIDPAERDAAIQLHHLGIRYRGNFFSKPIAVNPEQPIHGIVNPPVQGNWEGVSLALLPGTQDPYFFVMDLPSPPPAHHWLLKSISSLLFLVPVVALAMTGGRRPIEAVLRLLFAWGLQCFNVLSNWNAKQPSYEQSGFRFWHHTLAVLLLLALFGVSRWYHLPLIGSYGDDSHKWLHAKMLVGAIPLSEWQWDHHTARLTIMVATWLVQATLGWDHLLYYLPALVTCVILLLALYAVGTRLLHPAAGFAGAVCTILWSPFEFHQLMPEPFVASTWVVAMVLLFHWHQHHDPERRLEWSLVGAACVTLLAYFSWIGALFFMPAVAWLLYRRGGLRPLVIYFGILLAGYVIETGLYFFWAGIPGGRLSIIMANHMESVEYETEWMDIFRRYAFLPPFYKTMVLAYFASLPLAIWLAYRMQWRLWRFLWIPVSFFFLLTFCIKSINPLNLLLQHHQPRYVYSALPLVFLHFSLFGYALLRILTHLKAMQWLRSPALHVVVFGVVAFHFSGDLIRIHNPLSTFPARAREVAAYDQYSKLAEQLQLPFVEMDNPYSKGIKFYIDVLKPRTRLTPTFTEHWLTIGERYGRVILSERKDGPALEGPIQAYTSTDLCLYLYQMPFRLAFGTLSGLGDDRFGHPVPVTFPLIASDPIPWELRTQSDPLRARSASFELTTTVDPTNWDWRGELAEFGGTGSRSMVIEVDPRASLVRIPLQVGSVVRGLSVRVRDAFTTEVLADLPALLPTGDYWLYFDIPRQALGGCQRIQVEFVDTHSHPHAWIATAEPLWLASLGAEYP